MSKLDSLVPDAMYIVKLLCGDCGEELNRTSPKTGDDIKRTWTQLVMSGPLVAGKCPNDCRATFSDCNMNTKLSIVDVNEVEIFNA